MYGRVDEPSISSIEIDGRTGGRVRALGVQISVTQRDSPRDLYRGRKVAVAHSN